jgi:hypothetical protein
VSESSESGGVRESERRRHGIKVLDYVFSGLGVGGTGYIRM